MTKCLACGNTLTVSEAEENSAAAEYQYDNALWVGFFGGYSMFVDDIETEIGNKEPTLPGAAQEAVICHDCAHKLCEDVPWIRALLKPELSHSHGVAFWEKNPDHEGWDKPEALTGEPLKNHVMKLQALYENIT